MIELFKKIKIMNEVEKKDFLSQMIIKNYANNMLTEHDMWILTKAINDEQYLDSKLLEDEAPEEANLEVVDSLEIDDMELSSNPDTSDVDNNIDSIEASTENEEGIETSKAGIGILAMLGEIQDKLANGKPSEMEIAAIKALKKLVD